MVLFRSVEIATGMTASASAAARPDQTPKGHRTRLYTRKMESTPARAFGRASAKPVTPKKYALSACTQKPSGGLSTESEPPGSKAAKKKLCQETSMLLTVAA